jgi:hypothetical protein
VLAAESLVQAIDQASDDEDQEGAFRHDIITGVSATNSSMNA